MIPLFVAVGPTLGAQATTCAAEQPDAASAAAMARACATRVEILAGRSERTRVFANPDGTSTFQAAVGTQRSKWAYSNDINRNRNLRGQAWVGREPDSDALYRSYFEFPTSFNGLTFLGTQILSASFSIALDHSASCGNSVTNLYGTDAITVANAARMPWSARPLGSPARFLAAASAHADESGDCPGGKQPDALMTFGGNESMRADVQRTADGDAGTYTVGLCACDFDGTNERAPNRFKRFFVDDRTVLSVTYHDVAPEAPVVTPVPFGSAPVYTACDPAQVTTCTAVAGRGVAGAFVFSEPPGTTDVVAYVYGWDTPSVRVNVAAGEATDPVLITPTHSGLNRLVAYAVDRAGNASPTTTFVILVGGAAPGAVAYWPLDSLDGHFLTDRISGNALTASGVSFTDDVRYIGAKAATFDATGEATQDVPALDTSGSFSVAAWVRPAACTGDQVMVSVDADSVAGGNHTSAFSLGLDCTAMRWRVAVADTNAASPGLATAVSPAGTAVVGHWTFVVGTFDETLNQVQLWIDGALVQSTPADPAWVSAHGPGWRALGPVVLGRGQANNAPAGRFRGELADVRLWNRTVFDEDINGSDRDPATGIPGTRGLMSPLTVGSWAISDGECFCPDALDGSAFGRRLTLAPNWTLDPNWSGDPATTPAWFTDDSIDGNGAVRLDGVTGTATTADDAGTLDPADDLPHPVLRTDQSFTVSAWVRLDQTDTAQTVLSQDGDPNSGFTLSYRPGVGGGTWRFAVRASATDDTHITIAETPASTATTWHHLVGVVDAGRRQLSLYVDGELATTTALAAEWQPWQANGSFVVGRALVGGAPVDFLDGNVDDVTVWQGMLNAREIHGLS